METFIAVILVIVGLANECVPVLAIAALFALISRIDISINISNKGDNHVQP